MMKDSVIVGHLPHCFTVPYERRNDPVSSAWQLACTFLETFSILVVTKIFVFFNFDSGWAGENKLLIKISHSMVLLFVCYTVLILLIDTGGG